MNEIIDRESTGRKASMVAIMGNILLTIFNFIVGTLSGSTALVAEAAHTLSDVITSILAFIGFKIGMKPADKEHQYGHGMAEPIVGLIIVIFLVLVAYEILSDVYIKLLMHEALKAPDWTAAVMALIGIIVNYTMTTYLIRSGRRINSPALIADGQHQKVDIFSCGAVLVGVAGAQLGFTMLDPIVALFIAMMVIRTAFIVARDNINTIMGKIPSEEILDEIRTVAMSVDDVKGVHDVKLNNMGPYVSVELHIELDGDLKLRESHKISHIVEKQIINSVNSVKMAIVHTCPFEENKKE
ncbi:cation diffusion facilitator family transporter [Methanobacterium formicicum]|uniref:Cation diffusion facilitator family transporter n=2 Tax=Methanobacterium formicicum TaxID=2162 RepID=A0A090I8G2_METFO|nr:cation diffusion facilitator family transporter [Methanobacterium formicicum]MDH2658549.1 cation diffusion facilitator family transporter [Methanobacterium formicicum]CEA14583.1 cation diffusion facilitator family transporter [Methanobacterium formicicum]